MSLQIVGAQSINFSYPITVQEPLQNELSYNWTDILVGIIRPLASSIVFLSRLVDLHTSSYQSLKVELRDQTWCRLRWQWCVAATESGRSAWCSYIIYRVSCSHIYIYICSDLPVYIPCAALLWRDDSRRLIACVDHKVECRCNAYLPRARPWDPHYIEVTWCLKFLIRCIILLIYMWLISLWIAGYRQQQPQP